MSNRLKKIAKKMPGYHRTLYICNPNKNVKCKDAFKEGWCGTQCKCTVHPEYSKGNIKYDPKKDAYLEYKEACEKEAANGG